MGGEKDCTMREDDRPYAQVAQELTELRERVQVLEAFRAVYEQIQWHVRRLSALLQDANDAVSVLDLEGQILEWNPAAERLYGYTETEARGMHVTRLIPETEHRCEHRQRAALRNGAKLAPYETQRITKSGLRLDILLTMTRIAGEAGRQDSISSTEQDLTGQRRLATAEAALAQVSRAHQNGEAQIAALRRDVNTLCKELGRSQPHAE